MRYKEFYSTKKQGVAEGLEQKFKFYYSVFTHDEMQDFKERDQLDASGSPLVDMDEDEIIISASSVSEAYQKLLQHFPNQAVFVHSSTPIEQGVAEGTEDPSWKKGWELCNKDPSADVGFYLKKHGDKILDRREFIQGFNANAKSRGMRQYGDWGGHGVNPDLIRYKEIMRDRGVAEGEQQTSAHIRRQAKKQAPKVSGIYKVKYYGKEKPYEQYAYYDSANDFWLMSYSNLEDAERSAKDYITALKNRGDYSVYISNYQGNQVVWEPIQGVAEGSNDLYQKAIKKYAELAAKDYIGGGNEYRYDANKFDAKTFNVSQEKANKDFNIWFKLYVTSAVGRRKGVAEATGDEKFDTMLGNIVKDTPTDFVLSHPVTGELFKRGFKTREQAKAYNQQKEQGYYSVYSYQWWRDEIEPEIPSSQKKGMTEGWKEKAAGATLGAAALGGIGAGIAYSPMAYVDGKQIHMAMPGKIPDHAKLVTDDNGKKIYVWKSYPIKKSPGNTDGRLVYRPAEDVKEGMAEGKVVNPDFSKRFKPSLGGTVTKSPYYKNPDINIPTFDKRRNSVWRDGISNPKDREEFHHFEVDSTGRSYQITGITSSGAKVQVSTTPSKELAEVLVNSYNRGGFTDVDIERVPLPKKAKKKPNLNLVKKSDNISETSAGSVATVVNPKPKDRSKVGTLFGGTYKQRPQKDK